MHAQNGKLVQTTLRIMQFISSFGIWSKEYEGKNANKSISKEHIKWQCQLRSRSLS